MTKITPQQMRELADGRRTWMWHGDWDEEAEIALRATADQLEAVQAALDKQEAAGINVVFTDVVRAILTADTAPQDGDDD